jgi:hypothetical protein
MKKAKIALFIAVIVAMLMATGALALFTNGNFEASDFTGWTDPADMPIVPETVFLDTGLTGAQPYGWASVARGAGGVNLSAVVTSALDPNTNNALNMVHNGTYAARVNSQDSWSDAGHGKNANSIRQTFTVDSGDVQVDGSIHLAFAYAPVMVDPGHSASQQPYFFVGVRNLTTGQTLYEVFSLVNQAGYPWVAGPLNIYDEPWYYMPWQEVDLVSTAASPKMSVGDSIEIEVIASGCSLGGHPGYVYVDDFSFVIPSGCSPTLSTINPTSGPIAGGTQMTITGTNLDTVTALYVGTNSILPASFVSQTATSIVFNTPAGVAGYTNVTVVNPCGSASFFNGFQYISNAAPVADNDSYNTPKNTLLNAATVLTGDTDADNDPLTAIKVTDPAHAASFTFNSDGTFAYTPVNGYTGDDTFTYKANDGTADSNVATVTITVANSAPVADNDAYNTLMGTLLNGATVLTGDTDADNDPLTAIQVTPPSHAASFTFNSDGTFAYTPANGFSGDDTFTYKANDGALDSNTATVTITVVNNAPTALTLSNRFIQEERPAGWLIGLLAGTDPNIGDSLTYSLVSTVSCDGTDNGYFAVDGSNLEASATPIDYQTKYFLSVCVRATDLGGLTYDQHVTVVVRSLHHFPMDMNGDGTDDYVTFRPSTGTWHLRNSPPIVSFGQNGDLPVGADYNGDGKSDIAVFRPAATGTWHIRGQATPINFGTAGDVPLPVDYNGDGKADLMVFRPSTNTWHVRGYLLTQAFGQAGDIPVPADYNGDGKAELAIFRPGATGTWHVFGQAPVYNFGTTGDIPVPYDYNGDGKVDMAVYRPSTGVWHIRNIGTVTHGGFYDQPFPMFMNGAVRYMVIHAGPVAIEWQGFGMPTITFGANDDSHQ